MKEISMSRLVALAVVVAIIAFSVSGARASASTGASVKAVGGGWVGFIDTNKHYAQFSVSAHTGPTGDFGSAQFSITNEFGFPLDLWATIDCLNVFPVPGYHGGAWASGVVTKVNDPTGTYLIFPGDHVYFSMLDGGDPVLGSVDDFEAWYDKGVSCKLLDAYIEPPDVTSGNIVIDSPLDLP
jgi:hypothetical protein